MTRYILDYIPINPLSEKSPKQVIVLCHGYGGSGQDISVLANNWKRFLPEAIFLCPNAPEVCSINPSGYQWFDLNSENEEIIFQKSLLAEKKFNIFLDQILDDFKLNSKNLALVGFSQGCMMIIETALKRKEEVNSVLGYSGKIISKKNLNNNIISKPKIFLIHGDKDIVVPCNHLLEAKDFFTKHGLKIKTKLLKNCEHRISVEGSSLGLEFLRKNLL